MGLESKGMSNREKFKKAPGYIGTFLAGALAAHAMTSGKDTTPAYSDAQSYSDSGSSETTSNYGEGNFEYSEVPSPEAVEAISQLSAGFEVSRASQEQIAQIKAMVDTYIAEHPARPGSSSETTHDDGSSSGFSESSYDPLYELWNAVIVQPRANEMVLGLLLKELSGRMHTPSEGQ